MTRWGGVEPGLETCDSQLITAIIPTNPHLSTNENHVAGFLCVVFIFCTGHFDLTHSYLFNIYFLP